ncbi:MAG: hypothetical protein OH318_02155 [Candidatus Parvarchaeota archaeon]|nr:hypothetical protein [Candidatus Rehaiarchaeum fermentans]
MKAEESPSLKPASNFNDYAKNIENFNKSLNSAFLNVYKKINEIENSVDSIKKLTDKINEIENSIKTLKTLSSKDIDSIVNEVYSQVQNKVINTQINKEEIINIIKAQYDQKINQYEQKINQIYDYVSKVGQTVNSIVEKVNQNTDAINKLNDVLNLRNAELSKSVSEIEKEVSDLNDEFKKQINNLNENHQKENEEIQNKLNELEGKTAKMSEDLYKGIPQLNDLAQRTTIIEQKLSSIETTTERLTSVLNSDTLDISTFKTRIDTMASQMNALNDVINKAQQDILEFVKDSTSLVGILSKINPDAIQTSIKTLENGLSSTQQQVNKLVDLINTMQKELAELKAKSITNLPKQ